MDESDMIKEKIITVRELVEEERQRLIDIPKKPDFKEWLGKRSFPLDWMKKQFGETLKEKDGLTYPNGTKFDEANCNVCGKEAEIDEKVVNFSNDSNDMNICLNCLKRLVRNLTGEFETKE